MASARKQWTDGEVLKFWQDPKTRNLIVNAVPLECKFDTASAGHCQTTSDPNPKPGPTVSPSEDEVGREMPQNASSGLTSRFTQTVVSS